MTLLGRRLDDDIALITGASSGIGAAIAHALAAAGATVVLGARRADRLAAVKASIEAQTPRARVHALPLDVRDTASMDGFLAGAATVGPCTILVNNAGLAAGRARVDEAKAEDWDAMLDTNVRAVFALTRRVLPGFVERNRGDLVIIGSVAGQDAYAGGSMYCATKAAVMQLAKVVRREVLGKDIRVMLFEPGMVETELSLVRFGGDVEAAAKVYAGVDPVSSDDVADCVAFALTRPRHVCLDRMMVMATAQAGAATVHRRS